MKKIMLVIALAASMAVGASENLIDKTGSMILDEAQNMTPEKVKIYKGIATDVMTVYCKLQSQSLLLLMTEIPGGGNTVLDAVNLQVDEFIRRCGWMLD